MKPTAITITCAGCVFHQNIFLYNIINTKCLIRKDQHIVYSPPSKKKKKIVYSIWERNWFMLNHLNQNLKKNISNIYKNIPTVQI